MEYIIGIPTISPTRAVIQIHRFWAGLEPYPDIPVCRLPFDHRTGRYFIYREVYTPAMFRYWPVVEVTTPLPGKTFIQTGEKWREVEYTT